VELPGSLDSFDRLDATASGKAHEPVNAQGVSSCSSLPCIQSFFKDSRALPANQWVRQLLQGNLLWDDHAFWNAACVLDPAS